MWCNRMRNGSSYGRVCTKVHECTASAPVRLVLRAIAVVLQECLAVPPARVVPALGVEAACEGVRVVVGVPGDLPLLVRHAVAYILVNLRGSRRSVVCFL